MRPFRTQRRAGTRCRSESRARLSTVQHLHFDRFALIHPLRRGLLLMSESLGRGFEDVRIASRIRALSEPHPTRSMYLFIAPCQFALNSSDASFSSVD